MAKLYHSKSKLDIIGENNEVLCSLEGPIKCVEYFNFDTSKRKKVYEDENTIVYEDGAGYTFTHEGPIIRGLFTYTEK